MSDNEFKEIQEAFINESTELLEKMENALYLLETDPNNSDSINAVFRAIHTIKGTAGMFGFDFIVHFTHDIENLLDKVRDGKINLTKDLIHILLEARDHTQSLIEVEVNGEKPNSQVTSKSDEILAKISPFFSESDSATKATSDEVPKPITEPAYENLATENPYWHITLRPGANTFQNALEPMPFIHYLNKFGKIVNLVTVTGELPNSFTNFNPENNYLSFEISLESDADADSIRKSFDFMEYDSFIRVIPPHGGLGLYKELFQTSVIDKNIYNVIFTNNHFLTELELTTLLSLIGEPVKVIASPKEKEVTKEPILTEESAKVKTEDAPPPPALEQSTSNEGETSQITENATTTSISREAKTLRVDSIRVDQLIDLVGELVISGANIAQFANTESSSSRLQESSQILLRLIGEIRENTLKLRMVQIGETLQKFSRIVREVGRDLGKEVKLHISGGETELDKTVVEKINDPLLHIVRNAIDHGVETPEERKKAGKTEEGNLNLSAYHDTGNIVIKIEDDGRGLNKNKILEKAIAKGILKEGVSYTDNDIFQTIFHPGLSTADKITNISGRGVGLDVAQRNIDALRGNITIHSKEGKGTTFIIRLPLTLAIIDGFLVGVAKSLYIIPLDMILECVDMDASIENKTINHSENSNFINLRGELLPILKIKEIFNEKNRIHGRESIVIVQYAEKKTGLVVDKLYGEIQTVIKPLGKLFDNTKLLSGTTILGNGEVAMILDVGTLITLFSNESTEVLEKAGQI